MKDSREQMTAQKVTKRFEENNEKMICLKKGTSEFQYRRIFLQKKKMQLRCLLILNWSIPKYGSGKENIWINTFYELNNDLYA